uniref:E3 ubiquitin-protein ligase TRIM39-like n=1 Tax=Kryptolebias marmoratus TaxID=37003 RepID=A0A3Q3ACV2_KRYMA
VWKLSPLQTRGTRVGLGHEMASSSSLSEDQFLCPICLEVFFKPVSTPCGHNFCMSCITSYWDDTPVWQCPICKEDFPKRPNLKVNTFISELVSQVTSLHVTSSPNRSPAQRQVGSDVHCDVCPDSQNGAVRSCLECLASYCDRHLEPHFVASGLKTHTLVEPTVNLVSKVCRKHHRLLNLFCRNDNSVLCDFCVSAEHPSHDMVLVQKGYYAMKAQLGQSEAKVQRMIQERLQKVQNTRTSVKQSKTKAKEVMANGTRGLKELGLEIKKIQTELIKVVEEKQKTAEEKAEGFIRDLETEICDLKAMAKNMERLQQTKDQFSFLQSYSNLSRLPHTKDLSMFSFTQHLELQHMHKYLRNSISQLSEDVSNTVTLRYMQQYEVDIVLDPDTAHPLLSLSADGKQVRYNTGTGLWGNQVLTPNMFTTHLAVLGRRGFMSCKFYFEVCVGQKTEWCLGVATASIQRVGAIVRNSEHGLWAVWFLVDKFETFSSPGVSVHVGDVERVGVFVDYDRGEITFFDVIRATQIHSFTECFFTEELYPYFNPCDNEYGSNLGPMVIVPVCMDYKV